MSNETRHSAAAAARSYGGRTEDPLAELARLIGQGDPFAAAPRREPVMAAASADQVDPRDFFPAPPAPADRDPPRFVPPAEWDNARQEPEFEEFRFEDPRLAHARHDAGPHADAGYGGDARGYRDDEYVVAPSVAPDGSGDLRGLVHAMPPPPQALDDGYEDEAPVRRGRGGLLTVVSVLGLAVLGTAGAFAYRSMGGPSEVRTPPVIKADSQPTKIVPTPSAPATAEQAAPAKTAERIVPREEQPVSVTEAARANQPRVVLQGAPVAVPAAAPPPGSSSGPAPAFRDPPVTASTPPAARAPTSAPTGQAAASTEAPRQVRTVPIRPEGQPAAPAARPPAVPAPAVAAPAQTAALPPAATGGSFVVQVTSQRTEAEAQSAFRGLQQRHSALASYRPIIRRADLGERGTFFRAAVGPFASRDEANQMCINLKAQGGDCVVQRN